MKKVILGLLPVLAAALTVNTVLAEGSSSSIQFAKGSCVSTNMNRRPCAPYYCGDTSFKPKRPAKSFCSVWQLSPEMYDECMSKEYPAVLTKYYANQCEKVKAKLYKFGETKCKVEYTAQTNKALGATCTGPEADENLGKIKVLWRVN